jgi:hypothetical protein
MLWRAVSRAKRAVCLAVVLSFTPAALADPDCGNCCTHWPHCPPCFIHCQEGPPKIKFSCGCPAPVCGPCTLEHFGYYQPCVRPYPWPPDWDHCPVPPPSLATTASVPVITMPAPGGRLTPQADPNQILPTPRRANY